MFVEITRKKLTAGDSRLAKTQWAARGGEGGREEVRAGKKIKDRNVGRAAFKRGIVSSKQF